MTENTQRLSAAELAEIERMLAQDVDLPTRAALLFAAGHLLSELRAVIAERDEARRQPDSWFQAWQDKPEQTLSVDARTTDMKLDDHERRLAALEAGPDPDAEAEQEAEICVYCGKRVSGLGPHHQYSCPYYVPF
jgi:hypothetical protein